ncbi:MAG TPA: DUF547 domain-containing protein [Candidatus Binatia bacterium]|nr:DUF547 domain-containing protein [Candidatus Binatia bacterium]
MKLSFGRTRQNDRPRQVATNGSDLWCIPLALLVATVAAAGEPSDDPWATILAKRVRATGEVAYRSLERNDAALLDRVLAGLADVDATRLDRDHAVAFWINAYHALVIAAVVHGERPETVPQRARMFHWFGERIAGARRTLDDVRVILGGYASADPRIHLAISNGTLGGPPLVAEPYAAERLDSQLARAAYRFVNAPEYNLADPSTGRVEVSRLFGWYRPDFERQAGSLADFLRPFAARSDLRDMLNVAGVTIAYRPFDWRLNAAAGERPGE